MFFNELELLDLKITEESPHVDKIFVVESSVTYSGIPKPINFPAGKYASNPKVRYVLLGEDRLKSCATPWDRERLQRNLPRELIVPSDDDVWLVTDIDEIVNGEKIPNIVECVRKYWYLALDMKMYYYHIDTLFPEDWNYPYAAIGHVARRYTFDQLRRDRKRVKPKRKMVNVGKHFSFLGGAENISLKLKSFSHTEYSGDKFSDVSVVRERLDSLTDVCGRGHVMSVVDVDSSYPKTILDNPDAWNKYRYKH